MLSNGEKMGQEWALLASAFLRHPHVQLEQFALVILRVGFKDQGGDAAE